MKGTGPFLAVFFALFSPLVNAQDYYPSWAIVESSTGEVTAIHHPGESMADRFQRLEAKMAALHAELQSLRGQPARLPAAEPPPADFSSHGGWKTSALDAAPPSSPPVTMSQVQAAIKKAAWRKGDFTITPYGALWGSMTFETERSFTGDYTMYVFSTQDEGESAFHLDAKSTRLGIDIVGPRLAFFDCAQSGGKVEIDFQGTFIRENKPGVLLRHAYWEVKDENYRLLMGQTWDVISPLLPGTIMYSVYWGAGNIGYRRAQCRGERYFHLNDAVMVTVQGSLNVDITDTVSDATGMFTDDHANWPVLEGRVALTLGERGPAARPITLGISGHIGEQIYDFTASNYGPARDDTPIRTWSFNVDLRVPITERLGVQGEFFVGDNLGQYMGGILQGVDPLFRRPIGATGGWLEVWYDITPRLHAHVGYTIDDPNDHDLSQLSQRRYNHCYWGNLVFDVSKQFQMGLEVGSWRTLYVGKEPGESVRVEMMAKYNF